tara:strand:+ start:546 stop:1280 length:735 start_codon:yes stop_codon:yes gene_type:complete
MNQKINPEIAEILGAFIGDGWIESRGNAFYITGDKLEDKDYYDNFLAPLFSKWFCKVKPKEFSYWNVYGIGCFKRRIVENCLKLGFQSGTKALNVKIPKEIMNSSNQEIIRAVLRGIFDTDGSFWCEKSRSKNSVQWKRTHHHHPELQIGSCSKQLLEQIKILLERFHIESKVSLRTKAGFTNNRNRNNYYGLRIRKIGEIKKWFNIIGSNNPRHQTRYAVWKKLGYLPPRTTITQRKEMLIQE